MFNKSLSYAATLIVAVSMVPSPASAVPLFAQRYHLRCGACHSVLPELNSFGNAFRNRGYQLAGIPKHGTTGVAMRYQLEYEKDPAAGSRRFTPGGVILSNADIGAVSAFLHYNLGAGGGPAGAYLAYAATYNPHTKALYRAGLFELPLQQSPGQRLDDLSPYGYYSTRVGLNDLTLSAPRWGLQMQRQFGQMTGSLTFALAEFKGAPYGGKPVATGETTAAHVPEIGLFLRAPLRPGIDVGGEVLGGTRDITPTGRLTFSDRYVRSGLFAHGASKRFDLLAEQWWGGDANADGFGNTLGSSGGYVRLKYYPSEHFYLGVRYNAAAAPQAVRNFVWYAAAHVTPHARLIIERRQPLGGQGPGTFGAAVTVGFPWPSNL